MSGRGVKTGLVAACALVAGIGLGHWLLDERAGAPPAVAAAEGGSARLEAELRELASSLQALARALERHALAPASAPTPTSAEREPAAPPPPLQDSAELATSLRALAAAVGEMRASSGRESRPAPEDLVTPAWVDREGAFAATGMRQAALAGSEDAWERAERSFRAKHLFWTTQEVLSVYGAPDDIDIDGDSRQWEYRNVFEGGREEFYFAFDRETVYEASYNHERR